MAHGFHLDGPAMRALQQSGTHPVFTPPEAEAVSNKPRDRIWELAETLHCSIVGTCLSTTDGRSLLAKLGVADARTMSEHRLHGQVVHLAGRRDGGAKLLQKMLDRRHEREIRRFGKAQTVDEVRTLWREALERGEIPGAYWAAITHPATDWGLVQDIFGEVHMLSHLVGQSNRADIRRLRQLEASLSEQEERIAAQESRIRALTEQRDDLSGRQSALESEHALAQSAARQAASPKPDEAIRSLEIRLARENAHATALEEKVAVLIQASARLSAELEAEAAHRRAIEAELAAVEVLLGNGEDAQAEPEARTGAPADLRGRTLLYVGGRPRQVARLSRFTEERGGRLLTHDGGIEDSMTLLPGLVSQCDVALFPVACVSHEATGMVKRFCEAVGKPFVPVRSASLASFVHAARALTGRDISE